MATKIYDHITIDGDDAKLDGSVIANLENNEEFDALKEDLQDIDERVEALEEGGTGSLSGEAITALLACFANVVWANGNGDALYDALNDALLGTSYTVTYNLTNCVSSNTSTLVDEGHQYSTLITANTGAILGTVTCTMGGVAQTVTDGSINIASVTGDIVITAVAEEPNVGYTVVGNPTIEDGILTPSDGNYVLSKRSLHSSETDTWEIQTKFKLSAMTVYQDLMVSLDENNERTRSLQCELTSGPRMTLFMGTGEDRWNITSNPIYAEVSVDTWYWIKVGRERTTLYMEVSTDGETFTRKQDTNSKLTAGFDVMAFGRKVTEQFTGQIDLNETKYLENGVVVWEAITS